MENAMKKPLEGLRVLDVTRVLAGPFCTMILGDLGAEIIKIEKRPNGDDSRAFGPFINGESTYFMSLNRNKKSICIDLHADEGKDIFLKLVKQVDVIVENFRPGVMKRLGLGYSQLKKENPKIIYAAISGFGQDGPKKDKPAYDFIVQGMGGIMGLNAQPGGLPTRVPIGLGDITAALYCVVGILSALRQREQTGVGQMLDISMLDCQVAILENPIVRFFAGDTPKPIGNTHPTISPTGAFATQDGYIILAIGNDNHWRKFCVTVGKEEWVNDRRFISNKKRTENMSELRELIEDLLYAHESRYWIKLIEDAGLPCGPVNSIQDITRDPQTSFRNMIINVEHPSAGTVKMSGMPIKFSGSDTVTAMPPPTIGQHGADILKRYLGYNQQRISELEKKNVI